MLDSDEFTYEIISISENHIEGFRQAVGSVARERKYLAFLDAPPFDMAKDFVLENIRDDRPHFVAICNEKVIGWCDISSLHRPAFEHAGSLGVGVVAGFRGKGIGSVLIRTAIRKAKEKGLSRVELTVRDGNVGAIALYEALGFVKEGLHRNAVRVDGVYEDLISMGLLLS